MESSVLGFGTFQGKPVDRIDLQTEDGAFRASFLNLGATLVSFHAPDSVGQSKEVTINYETLEEFLHYGRYFGSTVGRCCNRIRRGELNVNGKDYALAINNGPNHLHGGPNGWDRQLWVYSIIKTGGSITVKFSYESPDGEESYPGTVHASASYTLKNDGTIIMEFQATSEEDTVINMTNHVYWNLTGSPRSTTVMDHVLSMPCQQYLPVDENKIPTGLLAPVQGTAMDFHSAARSIGKQVDPDEGGFDHCFVIDSSSSVAPHELDLGALEKIRIPHAASVSDPTSGRIMQIFTTQPGIQIYTGNHFDAENTLYFQKHSGVAFETQHFPDAVHHPHFPSVVLKKGELYRQVTVHTFSC